MSLNAAARAAAALALVCLGLAGASLAAAPEAFAPEAFAWGLPPGVAPPPVPAGNPMSAVKVALGRRLFYDADLSLDGTLSCATCHEQHRAFADGTRTHPGVHGDPGLRNVMGLANVGYFPLLTFAEPKHTSLEVQMLTPLAGDRPVEMGMAGMGAALAERLGGDACYPRLFEAAFPGEPGGITQDKVVRAVSSFQRTLISLDAPYDRYRRGEATALSRRAKRGMDLFFGEDLNCAGCHAAPFFTDTAYHQIGRVGDGADRGVAEATGRTEDEGLFRTPSLRNATLTGPYGHDGQVATLETAVRGHFGFGSRIGRSQTRDLVAFIGALTDQGFVTDPNLALPKPGCPVP